MESNQPNQDSAATDSSVKESAARPWYKKKRYLIPIGIFLLAGIANELEANNEPNSENQVVQQEQSDNRTNSSSEESTDAQNPNRSESTNADDGASSDSTSAESGNQNANESGDSSVGRDEGSVDNAPSDSEQTLESEETDEGSESGSVSDQSGTSDSEESDRASTDDSTAGNNPEPSISVSQANAIDSAESYLRFSSFSRSGQIDQLEFEGFPNADSAFAVDFVSPDWFQQAAESAESYLEFSSFSRQGLIDQLEFEGFTTEQATYGVDQAGLGNGSSGSNGGETVSQANATESAESYLRFSSFSRSGLIEQLEFEGYSNADSVYAVDKVNPDWFEQAAKSAQSYLDFGSFSRQGLIDQLIFEGFTTEQAVYGVNAVGL